jgi:hypothetical protein
MERRCIWRYSLAAFDRSVLFVTMKKCEQGVGWHDCTVDKRTVHSFGSHRIPISPVKYDPIPTPYSIST